MKYKRIRKKPQKRRKVISQATKHKIMTVNKMLGHSCIPKCRVTISEDGYNMQIDESGNVKWKKEKHPQPRTLFHSSKRKKRGEIIRHKSELRGSPPIPEWGIAKTMKFVEDEKIAKWEKRHPRPVKEGNSDLFEKQFVPQWEAEREKELERIRDFVVSRYDKLKLIGRFETSKDRFEEKEIAKIKDTNGEGHDVNSLDPKKSKLLKKVQKITNTAKDKNPKLVSTHLKDHMQKHGRIILPDHKKAA